MRGDQCPRLAVTVAKLDGELTRPFKCVQRLGDRRAMVQAHDVVSAAKPQQRLHFLGGGALLRRFPVRDFQVGGGLAAAEQSQQQFATRPQRGPSGGPDPRIRQPARTTPMPPASRGATSPRRPPDSSPSQRLDARRLRQVIGRSPSCRRDARHRAYHRVGDRRCRRCRRTNDNLLEQVWRICSWAKTKRGCRPLSATNSRTRSASSSASSRSSSVSGASAVRNSNVKVRPTQEAAVRMFCAVSLMRSIRRPSTRRIVSGTSISPISTCGSHLPSASVSRWSFGKVTIDLFDEERDAFCLGVDQAHQPLGRLLAGQGVRRMAPTSSRAEALQRDAGHDLKAGRMLDAAGERVLGSRSTSR